jgi:hypothetical protein
MTEFENFFIGLAFLKCQMTVAASKQNDYRKPNRKDWSRFVYLLRVYRTQPSIYTDIPKDCSQKTGFGISGDCRYDRAHEPAKREFAFWFLRFTMFVFSFPNTLTKLCTDRCIHPSPQNCVKLVSNEKSLPCHFTPSSSLFGVVYICFGARFWLRILCY